MRIIRAKRWREYITKRYVHKTVRDIEYILHTWTHFHLNKFSFFRFFLSLNLLYHHFLSIVATNIKMDINKILELFNGIFLNLIIECRYSYFFRPHLFLLEYFSNVRLWDASKKREENQRFLFVISIFVYLLNRYINKMPNKSLILNSNKKKARNNNARSWTWTRLTSI